jgi:hypothetical protein
MPQDEHCDDSMSASFVRASTGTTATEGSIGLRRRRPYIHQVDDELGAA